MEELIEFEQDAEKSNFGASLASLVAGAGLALVGYSCDSDFCAYACYIGSAVYGVNSAAELAKGIWNSFRL